MILQAAADFELDLPGSVLIGDSMSDIEAAAAAGVGTRIRLDPDGTPPVAGVAAHEVARNLAEALAMLRAHARRIDAIPPAGRVR